MVANRKAVAALVGLGMKYGPDAYSAVRNAREPAQAAAKKLVSQRTTRQQALSHAETLLDGSIYKAYSGDELVWVVFSGDQAVATHPRTDVPVESLLTHADLSKRLRPGEVGRRGRRTRAIREAVIVQHIEPPEDRPTS